MVEFISKEVMDTIMPFMVRSSGYIMNNGTSQTKDIVKFIRNLDYEKCALVKGQIYKRMFPEVSKVDFSKRHPKVLIFAITSFMEEREEFVFLFASSFNELCDVINEYQYCSKTYYYNYCEQTVKITQVDKDYYVIDDKYLFTGSEEELFKEIFGNKKVATNISSKTLMDWDKESFKEYKRAQNREKEENFRQIPLSHKDRGGCRD